MVDEGAVGVVSEPATDIDPDSYEYIGVHCPNGWDHSLWPEDHSRCCVCDGDSANALRATIKRLRAALKAITQGSTSRAYGIEYTTQQGSRRASIALTETQRKLLRAVALDAGEVECTCGIVQEHESERCRATRHRVIFVSEDRAALDAGESSEKEVEK